MSALGIDAVAPHDPHIMGNLLYVSWFQAGTLIFDITNPSSPVFIGVYDTWPGAVSPGQLQGNWGVYPYLGQDRVLISDRNTGLYIVNATGVSSSPALYNLHVNPSTVLAGSLSAGTVYLVGVAGAGGIVVSTSSGRVGRRQGEGQRELRRAPHRRGPVDPLRGARWPVPVRAAVGRPNVLRDHRQCQSHHYAGRRLLACRRAEQPDAVSEPDRYVQWHRNRL